MKVLFYLTWPIEDASSRYRVYQFEKKLTGKNIITKYDILFPRWFLQIKNRKGYLVFLLKVFFTMYFLILRIFRIPLAIGYDVVFVHREVFPFFTPFFERVLRKLAKKMVFDFDDAIFLKPLKWKNWRDIFRNPSRVGEVCSMSDRVIVGNQFLADYALGFNKNVYIIPTVYKVDNPPQPINNAIPVIGWIGSWSTTVNLNVVSRALSLLAIQNEFILRLVGAKNIHDIRFESVKTEYFDWRIDKELEYLNSFDIGIMPLFDTPWEKGKCGFKLIQYMTLGKPVVASPVGVNTELVLHGKSGFFASSDEDWVNYLSVLIRNIDERKKMGTLGKQIVMEKYSFNESLLKFVDAISNRSD